MTAITVYPTFPSNSSTLTILNALTLLSYIIILYLLYQLKILRCLIRPHNKILLITYTFISFLIIVRTQWGHDLKSILLNFINTRNMLPFVMPFIILFLPNAKYFKDILKIFFYASLVMIPIWIFNLKDLVQIGFAGEHIGNYIPYFSAFLLGFPYLFNRKQNFALYAITFIYLILMILNARRNVTLSLGMYILFAYYIIIQNNIKRDPNRLGIILSISIIIIIAILIYWNSLMSGLFENLNARMNANTREEVNDLFFQDFMNAPLIDWIIGRGASGGYIQPSYNIETGEYSVLRNGIETGYLHFLLKGGIIYMISILLFILNAIRNAWKSNNLIYKYIELTLLYSFIDFYATTSISEFTPRLIIFWFCISMLCTENYKQYTKSNIRITDLQTNNKQSNIR